MAVCRFALLLFLAVFWTAGGSDSPSPSSLLALEDGADLAEKQYQQAVDIRSGNAPSAKQLKRAAVLAKAAAGVYIVEPGSKPAENELMRRHNLTEIHAGIFVAEKSHGAALVLLSELYAQEGQGLPTNPRASFELLRHAAGLGEAAAHRQVGQLLAAGIHPPKDGASHKGLFELGERDWPTAMLHLYFAASMNDSLAQMALGYRHAYGLGVPKSCPSAVLYYQAVAERVTHLAQYPYEFPRIERILLGSAAGRISLPSREQELLHYQWFADMGYVDAQRAVGRLLTAGGPRTAERALHYFRQAAQADDAEAMAHLGHMYANGVGVEADNGTALQWFRKGSERNNPSAHFGLGFMYLRGHGLPQDYRLAVRYLTAAAEQGYAEACFHLGNMHLHGWGVPASMQQALAFFGIAAKAGHVMSQYNLAMLYLRTKGQTHCELALNRLKAVAERGPWSMTLQHASEAYAEGDHARALMLYLKASEAGYDLAQANAAWMLGQNQGIPSGQSARDYVEPGQAPSFPALAALRSHQRASQQGNVDATLAIGDAFYYGKGVGRDWPKAFQVYSAAARFRNAQAHFNLGFMHEYGAGVPQDLALAKRNYDKAGDYLPGAAAPVRIALVSLWLHGWWNRLRPALPRSMEWLWAGIYSLKEPTGAMTPIGSHLLRPSFGGLERVLDAVWIAPPIAKVLFQIFIRPFKDRDGRLLFNAETLETAMLLVLVGCLCMVVWRRMRIRSARRRRNQPPPPAASPHPGEGSSGSSNPNNPEIQRPPQASQGSSPSAGGNPSLPAGSQTAHSGAVEDVGGPAQSHSVEADALEVGEAASRLFGIVMSPALQARSRVRGVHGTAGVSDLDRVLLREQMRPCRHLERDPMGLDAAVLAA